MSHTLCSHRSRDPSQYNSSKCVSRGFAVHLHNKQFLSSRFCTSVIISYVKSQFRS